MKNINTEQRQTNTLILLWAIALVLALAQRGAVLDLHFPAGDGGMFARMVEEIRLSNYALPKFSAYNLAEIPFTYPPLGFYLAAIVTDIFSVPTESALAVLPLIWFALTLIALVHLFQRYSVSPLATFLGLTPWVLTAPMWLFYGGGLTRTLGLSFSILASSFCIDVFALGRVRRWPWLSIFAACAALSHPESALFVFCTIFCFVIFAVVRQGLKPTLLLLGKVSTLSALLFLPWFTIVVANHGFDPWIQSLGTGLGSGAQFLYLTIANLSFLGHPALTVLLIVGLVTAFVSEKRNLVFWFLTIGLCISRSFPIAPMVAGSLLLSLAAEWLRPKIILFLNTPFKIIGSAGLFLAIFFISQQRALVGAAAPYIYYDGSRGPPMRLSAQWQTELRSVSKQLRPEEKLVLISDWEDEGTMWFCDWAAEWLPYYASVRVLNTTQGTEWLSSQLFEELRRAYVVRYNPLVDCTLQGRLPDDAPKTPTLLLAQSATPKAQAFLESAKLCGYKIEYSNELFQLLRHASAS
jgi:hypothetical protein